MKVLLDACVLYPTVLREMLLGCAAAGLYQPLWSDRILGEWARAAARLGAAQAAIAQGEVTTARAQFPQAMVPPDPGLERRLWLPDPDDVHVLAAAVAGSADAIVTQNAADFPRGVLAEQDLVRIDPDLFLVTLHDRDPAAVTAIATGVAAQASRLSGEHWSPRRLMKRGRLHRFAKRLPPDTAP
jgi:predicted nucleic acid-binding protein